MDKQNLYQKDNLIVRFSRIYKIKKVKKKKRDDQKINLVYYQPKYPRPAERKLQLTIPMKKMSELNVRGLVKKTNLDKYLKKMESTAKKKSKKASTRKQKAKLEQARNAIKANNLEKITKHIALLWAEKTQSEKKISHTKKKLLNGMINKIKEEIAVVYDLSLEKSQEKIYQYLPNEE